MKSSKFYTIALLLALSQSSSVKAVESTGLKAVKAREAEEKAKQNALIQNSVDANLDLNLENLDDLIENFKTVKNDASNMAKGSMSLIKNQTMYNDSLLKLMKDIVKQSVNFLGDEVKSKFSNVLDKSYGISVVNTESDLKRYNILLDKDTKQLFEEFDGIISKKKEQIDSSDSDAKISEGFEKFSESFKSLVATMVEGSLNTNNEWKSTQTPENLKAIAKNNLNEIVKVLDTAINSAQKLKDAALANRESSHKKLQDSKEEQAEINSFRTFVLNFPEKLHTVSTRLNQIASEPLKVDLSNVSASLSAYGTLQNRAFEGSFSDLIKHNPEKQKQLNILLENFLQGHKNGSQLNVERNFYNDLENFSNAFLESVILRISDVGHRSLSEDRKSSDLILKITRELNTLIIQMNEEFINTGFNLNQKQNHDAESIIKSHLKNLRKTVDDVTSNLKKINIEHAVDIKQG